MDTLLRTKIVELDRILEKNKPNAEDVAKVRELLGRNPDGMSAVIKKDNRIMTVVSNTIVRKKPFPTLFWLVDREATKRISAIESRGLIKELEKDQNIIDLMVQDNSTYAALRSYYHELHNSPLSEDSPFYKTIYQTGAGGLQDHKRIRCLHLHMAYHYSVGSLFGEYLVKRYPELEI